MEVIKKRNRKLAVVKTSYKVGVHSRDRSRLVCIVTLKSSVKKKRNGVDFVFTRTRTRRKPTVYAAFVLGTNISNTSVLDGQKLFKVFWIELPPHPPLTPFDPVCPCLTPFDPV